jgi:hypothetical protein
MSQHEEHQSPEEWLSKCTDPNAPAEFVGDGVGVVSTGEPFTATHQPSFVEISAVITRADGTVQDLGLVHARYRSPFKHMWWRLVRRPAANRRIKRANRSATTETEKV